MSGRCPRYLCIYNTGEIPEGALTLLGASTKEGDSAKIGFFGSGNKYAIACLMRLGIPFYIYSGLRNIPISTRPVSLGNETFEQILIDGNTTSFTTRMGPHWIPWYAIREFVSNAIDEGGYAMERLESPQPMAGRTLIAIEIVPEIAEVVQNLRLYFLDTTKRPHIDCGEGRMLHKQVADRLFRLYRRGILVYEDPYMLSAYRYEDDSLEINESRTVPSLSPFLYQGDAFVKHLRSPAAIRKIADAVRDRRYIESRFEWPSYSMKPLYPEAWVKAFGDQRIVSEEMTTFLPPEDYEDAYIAPARFYFFLRRHVPGLKFLASRGEYTLIREDGHNEPKVQERLQAFLNAQIGVRTDVPIHIVSFHDENVFGTYSPTDRIVRISTRLREKAPPVNLGVVLLEELSHAMGYDDGSRLFEQYLEHLVVALIDRLAEATAKA